MIRSMATPTATPDPSSRLQAVRARALVLLVAAAAVFHRGAPDLFTLAGGTLIAVGAGLIALPAGLIVGGLLLAAFGIALDLARARATGSGA